MTEITDSRIRAKCRRGLLELDLMLERFCKQSLTTLSDEQKAAFFLFLDTPDQILSDWLFDLADPEEPEYLLFVQMIRSISFR